MCGIAGVVRFDGQRPDGAEIERVTDALAHRGPDGRGVEILGPVALGHRRLAIIDLEGGRQPLFDDSGTLGITFNGEIYNYLELRAELEGAGYRFRTRSDTETILHGYAEWGEGVLERLRGMFAFGIWDAKARTLFLARDRLGIKPLLYWHRGSRLDFASELSAFRALDDPPSRIDPVALDWYLELLYVPAPLTVFAGLRKLEPGTWLRVDADGTMESRRYWAPRFAPDTAPTEDEWLERLDACLEEAVRLHRVADVPVGTFVSGGLDSSLVTAYVARQAAGGVRSFTIGHHDEEFDEAPKARAVARALGVEHHLEVLEGGSDEILPILARHYGEPFGDSSAVPTWIVSRLARRFVKVVLSGDGGDESFAGYPWLAGTLESFLFPSRSLGALARRVGRPVLAWLREGRGREGPLEVLARSRAAFTLEERRQLWRSPWRKAATGHPSLLELSRDEMKGLDLCSQIQWFDFRWYLPGDILTKVDVASMFHGLEVRVPLLDHVVVELVATMPSELKIRSLYGRGTVTKLLLKRLAERYLDREVVHAPKKGFGLPTQRWFDPKRRERMTAAILDEKTGVGGLLEPAAARRLLDADRGGVKLWALWVLHEWLAAHPGAAFEA